MEYHRAINEESDRGIIRIPNMQNAQHLTSYLATIAGAQQLPSNEGKKKN